MADIAKHSEYSNWVHNLKLQIKTRQIKAAISVNSQMIMLYWDLGRQITEKQEKAKWGSGFIEQLSNDLRKEFPEMTGFSRVNLIYMRKFYKFYSSFTIGQQLVDQLQVIEKQQDTIIAQLVRQLALMPWGHHTVLLGKAKNLKEALFYIHKTVKNNWFII